MKKYDERDTLFARVHLDKNSKEYKEYYKDKRGQKLKDDPQRNMPFRHKLRKSDAYKERFFPLISNNKKVINSYHQLAFNHPVSSKRIDIDHNFTNNIKEITKYYGATSVGITRISDYNYYSHMGGLTEHVGLQTLNKKIIPRYNTAIVFTIAMDKKMMNRAPMFEELLATEQAYVKVAEVGSRLTMYLRELGYKTIFEHSEYYETPLVPLAHDAGLGQIGMCNHIVTKEHGNSVRLGAVLTTLELDYDQPIDYGLHDFCKKCALCLSNCPSKAITHKPRIVNGRQFYKFDDNKCFDMWLKSGTDCGTCISACPFTQGMDLSKINRMKDEPHLMAELMAEHYEIYGRRVFDKEDLDIVKLEKKNEPNN